MNIFNIMLPHSTSHSALTVNRGEPIVSLSCSICLSQSLPSPVFYHCSYPNSCHIYRLCSQVLRECEQDPKVVAQKHLSPFTYAGDSISVLFLRNLIFFDCVLFSSLLPVL